MTASAGAFTETAKGFFTCYTLTLPEQKIQPSIKQLGADCFAITLSTALLEGRSDAFLSIDYTGDMGHAYLDGQLVSDHFFHGFPWEIGLKRFVLADKEQELIVRISPLRPDAAAARYVPTGMAFRPADDETALLKMNSITLVPEYQVFLSLQRAYPATLGLSLSRG